MYYKVRDIYFFHYYAARKIFTVRCPWELCLIRTFIFSPDKSTAIWRRVTSLPDAASFTSLRTPVVQFVSVCIFSDDIEFYHFKTKQKTKNPDSWPNLKSWTVKWIPRLLSSPIWFDFLSLDSKTKGKNLQKKKAEGTFCSFLLLV